ncbi:MAG: efflux RND transporter periplasmic adaptor subunit [Bacteroidales bacterium]|nr:efflux RND transporter periplasmic adaptor subunit [Bacteroidales bacterium]
MVTKYKYSVLRIFILLILCSCSSVNKEDINTKTNTSSTSYTVSLTNEQIKYAEIQIIRIKKHLISEEIECTGSVEASPNSQAVVGVPMKGYLKTIDAHIGQYVEKGQKLASAEHPDYIDLQLAYIETKSEFEYLHQDYKRQGELSLENAASLKTLQKSQAEFQKTEARLIALKKHLAFLGIDGDSLHIEDIHSEIILRSPISGIVTKVNGIIGMLYNENEPVFGIVCNNNPILHLKVFEKDANRIMRGQQVKFSPLNKIDQISKAKIISTTKSIDTDNSLNIYAQIKDPNADLLPGMYVRGSILIQSDSVYALPQNDVICLEEECLVFIKTDSSLFKALPVETGLVYQDLIEIINTSDQLLNSDIVTQGAYYLYSKLLEEE